MVAGEICDAALKPVVDLAPAAVEEELEISNGSAPLEKKPEDCVEPVDCVEDDSDEASDWMALNAVDAAPMANSI
jgi:hypothetical protein